MIFTDLLTAILITIFSIVTHEIAHLEKAKALGYVNLRLQFTFKEGLFINLPDAMAPSDKLKVLNAGIVWGGLVSLISVITIPLLSPAVVLFYFFGCKHDLKMIKELRGVRK